MFDNRGWSAIRRLSLIAVLAAPSTARAQKAADLAKKLSNPIADLVSVPFQFNWEHGVGPNAGTRFILHVQPVMPFTLSRDLNLMARVIVPLVSQPALVEGGVYSARAREGSPVACTD